MLTGKELILATKPFAEDKVSRSRWEVVSTLLFFIVCYIGLWFIPLLVVKFLFSILIALTIVRMFVIDHDYLHNTILHDERWAKILFTFFGLAILVPPSIWKRSHDYHHKHNSKLYTSSIGSYPIVTKDRFNKAARKEQILYLFIRHPLTILFGYFFGFIYGMCIRSFLNNPKLHYDSLISLALHATIAVLFFWLGGWSLMMLGWIVPNMIATAMGAYLFYAQHNFPEASFSKKEEWNYVEAAMQSSSYMKMSKLMHWFTGNIGYHHIHHLNARIPFYRLPEVFSTFEELQQPKTTSLHPRDIISCLKLKVYDPELNRMITKKEMVS